MAASSDWVAALSRELAAGRDFEALLESERDCLLHSGADRLVELCARKADLAREIAALAAERNTALARSGLPRGRAGVELGCSGAGSAAKGLVEQLTQCARRVRDLNRRNEILVNMRLQQVGAALNVLRGSGAEAQVYSADGRAHTGAGRLTRATA
jgi:flagellar biosynthesis/type III secretory pathway chaperone